jgi:chromate transporter
MEGRLREVAWVFLKLGLLAFGGPATHVALMRRELVQRRRWLDEAEFLRMFAACNLVPGPSSTELAIFLGYRRAGWRALLLAGLLFILPAMLIMLVVAWAYTRFGSSSLRSPILHGVRPVVVGIVAWAISDLGRRMVRRWRLALLAAVVGALFLIGLSPVLLLLLGGAAVVAASGLHRRGARPGGPSLVAVSAALAPHLDRLPTLALTFLEIGLVSFGSGYVLLAFLRADFVLGLHWMNDQQLVDAIAIGQATPGPVFTTATFLGYLFAGLPGALVATVAIFLPGFVLVPFLDRIVAAVERRPLAQGFVDGANAAAVGLICAVTLQLARASIVDPLSGALAAVSFAVMLRWPLSTPALVGAGAGAGLVAAAVR